MTTDSRALFRNLFRARCILRFMLLGGKKLIKSPWRLLGLVFAMTLTGILYAHLPMLIETGLTSNMIASMYRIIVVVIAFISLALYLWHLGRPKGYIRIMSQIGKLNLTNAAGELPVLIERQKLPDGKAEVWTFESYGIDIAQFQDNIEKLESAFDAAIVFVYPGENGRSVCLELVLHPGPWPKLLTFDEKKLNSDPRKLLLGENRGQVVYLDVTKTAHCCCIARTGHGKTVLEKCLLHNCLRFSSDWKVYLIDFKRGADFGPEWKSRLTIISDIESALKLLESIKAEMNRRIDLLSGCGNIDGAGEHMPRIAIFIDEIVEMLDKTGASKDRKEIIDKINGALSSIAVLGRAPGVHLFLFGQRISADTIPGAVRNNLYKIAGKLDENGSMLVLNNGDAYKRIPGNAPGRFITEDGVMFQGYYDKFSPETIPYSANNIK